MRTTTLPSTYLPLLHRAAPSYRPLLRLFNLHQTSSVIVQDVSRRYLIPHNLHCLPRIQPTIRDLRRVQFHCIVIAIRLLLHGPLTILLLNQNTCERSLCFHGIVLLSVRHLLILLLPHDDLQRELLLLARRTIIVADKLCSFCIMQLI